MSFFTPPQNLSLLLRAPLPPPSFAHVQRDLIPGLPDGILALLAPVMAYWVYSTMFHLIDVYELAEKYRIHPSEEEASRNKASLKEVLSDVILQHCIQTFVGYVFFKLDAPPTTGHEVYRLWYLRQHYVPSFVPDRALWLGYTVLWPLLRIGLAFCFVDTWQYWLHRIMHQNKTLYRRFHSRHHRLYVPFAFGALYNDPVEGFLLDTLGSGIAALLTRLTPRELLLFFTFATLKTVDDHCGYRFPWDPFQFLFPNNALYHDIHHQNWGFRLNYSQPFFTFWDKINKTQYQFVNEYKEMQQKITLEKYKEFLERRKQRKAEIKKDI